MNSLLVFPDELLEGGQAIELIGARANDVFRSEHFESGDDIKFAVYGEPLKGIANVIESSAQRIALKTITLGDSLKLRAIDLVVGLSRPQTTKKVIQAAVMAGVRSLHLVHLESGERSYLDSHLLRPEDLRREIAKGLQQVWEGLYPEISVYRDMRSFLKQRSELLGGAAQGQIKVVAHPANSEVNCAAFSGYSSAVIAVGSEGGFNQRELEVFTERGFTALGLGARVVRVEVALIYLLGQSLGIG
jgi:16S rRNA (uracil1498-N3)-methyltransferase